MSGMRSHFCAIAIVAGACVAMGGHLTPGPYAPHTWSGFFTGVWIGDVPQDHDNAPFEPV